VGVEKNKISSCVNIFVVLFVELDYVVFYNVQSFIQGFARIIKQWQHQCIVESNKAHVVPFNIFINARYHHK